MSDRDPDPIDKAYAQAEAILSDEQARAARRARVLGAVAEATSDAASPATPRAWRRGGWLVAASVGGLSLLVATQINTPRSVETPPEPPVVVVEEQAAPPAAAERAKEAPAQKPPAATAARKAVAPVNVPADVAPPPPPPPAPPIQAARAEATAAAAPAPAPAAAPVDSGISEIVVTGSRIQAAPKASGNVAFRAAPSRLAARLRQAAAKGRIAAVAALLERGAPVDEPDDEGETALMKSVRAKHPAAAELLRRHGASLDRKNAAGESARDLAVSIGDADLDRALGLER